MFSEEKAQLISTLESIEKKLSFPQKLLENLKKSCLRELADIMELYNKNILQAIEYKNQLANMTEWGIFWNSYKLWSISVNKILIKHNTYKNNILELSTCVKASEDLNASIRNKILSQSSVDSKKLYIFMNVIKNNFEYSVDYFDESAGTFVISPIQYSNILNLLPICIIIEMGKSIFDCAHPVQFLDSIDTFSIKISTDM
jgi:hypothetical protein